MKKQINLVEGSIIKVLIALATPIICTSFIQMAYNMTDMFWLGNSGSNAVAAVGTASFFVWFGQSLMIISKIGAEIGVSQAIGKNDMNEAKHYISNSIKLNIILSLSYVLILILLRKPLIGFFNLGDDIVIKMATNYLVVVALSIPFNFINPILTGIFNGSGDSKTPFFINTIGLLFNIVFDPLLIYGFGIFPKLGVVGAALATVIAQVIVTICFLYVIKNRTESYFRINLKEKLDMNYIKRIAKLGMPVAAQNALFSFFSMIIARIIAGWGPSAIAVQKVGSQIEAISWMTAGGLSTALGAFVGQNFGAKKWNRIFKGYLITILLSVIVGIFATSLLIFGGKSIFAIFIPEKEAIEMGAVYLRILGYSQLFMCIEITTTGVFNGLGKTMIPSIISIIFTGLRIPMALILSMPSILGLNGVWWSISISSFIKGILLVLLFVFIILIPKKKLNSIEFN